MPFNTTKTLSSRAVVMLPIVKEINSVCVEVKRMYVMYTVTSVKIFRADLMKNDHHVWKLLFDLKVSSNCLFEVTLIPSLSRVI